LCPRPSSDGREPGEGHHVDDVGPNHADQRPLAGRRVVVVGASSGIGRAVVVAATEAGAVVAAAARRFDRLRDLAAECGSRVYPVQCDVRSNIGCELAMRTATDHIGPIDALLFATGVNHLGLLENTDTEAWQTVLETNLVGAALCTRAALPYLRLASTCGDRAVERRRGRVAYLSSHSVDEPWPGLGAYAVSKAGLDTMVEAWRAECPEIDFTRVVVGPTITGMADDWNPELASTMFTQWGEQGCLGAHAPVEATVVADAIVEWMAAPVAAPDLSMV
jgi:NAD(P)-dependent dehydrogenase (short-subunit alcohol dehydrogenase family)